MIIERNEKDIDEILDYFLKDGFEGPAVYIDKKQVDLYYWKDCMVEEYQKQGLLIFEPKWIWDNQENRIRKFLRWFAPVTLEEYQYENNRTDG